MNKSRFYYCKHCGNLVGMIHNSGVPIICCGEEMIQLTPNETDGAREKHLPKVKVEKSEVLVLVGEIEHPMEEDHYIQWIYLQTDIGGQRKALSPKDKPKVSFSLNNENPVCVYAYCNKHGLFRTVLN